MDIKRKPRSVKFGRLCSLVAFISFLAGYLGSKALLHQSAFLHSPPPEPITVSSIREPGCREYVKNELHSRGLDHYQTAIVRSLKTGEPVEVEPEDEHWANQTIGQLIIDVKAMEECGGFLQNKEPSVIE